MPDVRPIDANALLTKTRNYYPSMDHYCLSRHAVDAKDIEAAPTLDYEPVRHGEWVWVEDKNQTIIFNLTCSVCGSSERVDPDHLYCPYCGAKMDGGNKP